MWTDKNTIAMHGMALLLVLMLIHPKTWVPLFGILVLFLISLF